MKLIGDEIKYAEKCINHKRMNKKKQRKTLMVLSKYYYYHHNYDKDTIKALLIDFLMSVKSDFKHEHLDELIDYIINDGSPLNVVDKVCITEDEMSIIESRESEQEKRVLFTMLIQYKVKNSLFPTNNNKINEEHSTIFKDANVTCLKKDKFKIMHRLHHDGLIELSPNLNDSRITLNYVNDESPVLMEITSYEDFIMDYYIYKGRKVIPCRKCGERLLIQGNSRKCYCAKCKEEKQLEHQRNSMAQLRKSCSNREKNECEVL